MLPSALPAYVERIRQTDGVSLWLLPLTRPAGQLGTVSDIAMHADRILVAGSICTEDTFPERCELSLWRTTTAGSSVEVTSPTLDLPTFGRAISAAQDTTVAAAIESAVTGQQLHVKRIRNSDGVALWESRSPVSLSNAAGRKIDWISLGRTTPNGDVAVLFGNVPTSAVSRGSAGAMVAKLNGTDGSLRWMRSLLDSSGGYTDVRAFQSVELDSAGSVFVSVHEAALDFFPSNPVTNRRQVRKYASATGQDLLQIDFAAASATTGLDYAPINFKLNANDVLTNGQPSANPTTAMLTDHDGTTGSVKWTNPQLLITDFPNLQPAMDYGYRANNTGFFAFRIEPTTGVELWRTVYANPADIGYGPATSRIGSDGAIYISSSRSEIVGTSFGDALVMRIDPATGNMTWVNRLESRPASSWPVLKFGLDDVLYSLHNQIYANTRGARFLSRFSEVDGSFLGTRLATISDARTPDLDYQNLDILGADASGGSIYYGTADAPGRPTRYIVQRRAIETPSALGSLRVELSSAVTRLGDEMIVSFQFDSINDGSVAAPGVDAFLDFPVQAIVSDLTCDIAGNACNPTVTPIYVKHQADIAVGQRMRITATLRFPLQQQFPTISAGAISYELEETNVQNNFIAQQLNDVLFRSGLD